MWNKKHDIMQTFKRLPLCICSMCHHDDCCSVRESQRDEIILQCIDTVSVALTLQGKYQLINQAEHRRPLFIVACWNIFILSHWAILIKSRVSVKIITVELLFNKLLSRAMTHMPLRITGEKSCCKCRLEPFKQLLLIFILFQKHKKNWFEL